MRHDDKQIFHRRVTDIQQGTMLVQKANLQPVNSPGIFTSIGNDTRQEIIGFRRFPIERSAQNNQISSVAIKTSPSVLWSGLVNDPDCRCNEHQCRNPQRQLLPPQRKSDLWRTTKRTHFCRLFDRFGTKRTDFSWFGLGHKRYACSSSPSPGAFHHSLNSSLTTPRNWFSLSTTLLSLASNSFRSL
jgi:hypothetical protein